MILIIPILMVIGGAWMKFWPPKDRNSYVGYRTKASMKSQEAWDFAQQYCGKLWLGVGLVMLVVSALAYRFIKPLRNNSAVSILISVLQTALLCLTAVPVEKALKEKT